MDRVARTEAGAVLFDVKFSRQRATILTLVGVAWTGATLGLVVAADRTSWGTGQWLFAILAALLGSLIMIASARQVLSPATMLTVTEKGILLHLDGNRYVEGGHLIEWKDIEGLSLDTVSAWQGNDRRRFKTIVISLRPDVRPVPREANYGPPGPTGTVRIDAGNGTLKGEDLLRRLQQVHRHHPAHERR